MKKLLGILVLGLLVCSSNFVDAKSYKLDQIFKQWKNGSRKNLNDYILRCFALYNKYHLLVYQM